MTTRKKENPVNMAQKMASKSSTKQDGEATTKPLNERLIHDFTAKEKVLFWLLFSSKSIQNILILPAIVAPFASAGIRSVVNRLNQDTTVYYGLVLCLFF